MFFSFFSSKNQKLVKKWKREHEEIVVYAHKIIAAYSLDDKALVRKELIALRELAVEHLMREDIDLFKLVRKDKNLSEEMEKLIKEFTETFRDTKSALLAFLREYTKENSELDEKFFATFNEIVGVLAKRIEFEEKNLYVSLDEK
jgi:hypothetical protein